MIRPIIRCLTQLALALPIILISPLALPAGIIPLLPDFWANVFHGKIADASGLLVMALGAYGIVALPIAIFVPTAWTQKRKWLRRLIIVCLAGGSVTAIYLLIFAKWQKDSVGSVLQGLWLFGGPLIVAGWCIFRLSKRPNQTPEPTPLLVTDRADARSAPSKGVAHL